MDTEISPNDIKTYKNEHSKLGQGTFGRVHVCLYNERLCAIKLIPLYGAVDEMDDTVEDVKREAGIMKKMEMSCHIVGVFGIVKWDGWMGIVMEYAARNNLHHFIKREKENEIIYAMKLRMIYQIALGLSHLHNCSFYTSIAHNDLTPNNILLDEDLNVKISDFGGSSYLSRTGCQPHCLNDTSKVRTAAYTAPEYSEENPRTKEMDVFSFAIIINFVLSHKDPFPITPSGDIAGFYKAGERPSDPIERYVPTKHGDEIIGILNGIMKKCWSGEPNSRPAINDIKDQLKPHNHRVAADVNDFVEKYTNRYPVKTWENQQTISLESLCTSLNVPQPTPPSSIDSIQGQAGVMNRINVGALQRSLKKGDTFMLYTPNETFECVVKSVAQEGRRSNRAFDGPSTTIQKEDESSTSSERLEAQQP